MSDRDEQADATMIRLRKHAQDRRRRAESNLVEARARRGERRQQEQANLVEARARYGERKQQEQANLVEARAARLRVLQTPPKENRTFVGSREDPWADATRGIEEALARDDAMAGVPFSPDAPESYPSLRDIAFNIRGQLQDPRVANFQGTEDPTQSRSRFDDLLAQAQEQESQRRVVPSFDESSIGPVELDTTSRDDSAAEVLHGAAYDAVGSSDVGASASIGLDPDLVLHMDDFSETLRSIQEILLSQVKTEPTAESRRKATEMLRSSPGVIALIRAGDYKFEDFTTDGAIDIAKLTAARADLQKRIESSEESYALAAKARGYTPSGAAYPITGVNNIVAGNRRVADSNFVMYHGPQYSNG